MPQRPEQHGRQQAAGSASKILVACVLAAGFTAGHAGVAGAETNSSSSGSVDAEWDASWAAYRLEDQLAGSALSTVDVSLPITIHAPLDRVFAAYSNLRNGLGRHPFLTDVLDHRNYTDGDTEVREFIALESIPAGSADIPGRTVGQQRIHADEHWYTTETWDAPGVITQQTVVFAEADGATTVTEHLTFRAPAVLIDYTVQNGVSSHIENQQAMQRDIEAGTL